MKTRMRDTLSNRNALLHMVGQLHDMKKTFVLTGEITSIMCVTKPTAIKRLNALVECGLMVKNTKPHRSNADAFVWRLSSKAYDKYVSGVYEQDYKFFVAHRANFATLKPYDKVVSI